MTGFEKKLTRNGSRKKQNRLVNSVNCMCQDTVCQTRMTFIMKNLNATLARILNIRPGKRSYKYASRLITDSSMFQYINVALFSNINAAY